MSRNVPQNLEAEKCVLGSVLLDQHTAEVAFLILKPDYFYRRSHQLIFSVMADLVDRNEPVDLVILQEKLVQKDALDKVGGVEYLTELLESVPTAAHCEYYAKIVRDKHLLRSLISTCTDITQMAYESEESAEMIVDDAETKFFDLSQQRTVSTTYAIRDVLRDSFAELQSLRNQTTKITGIPSGYKDLDDMTSGFEPSQFIILAARPSMGKTTLALNMMLRQSLREGKSTLLFSMEMAKEQVTTNMLCSYGGFNSHKLRTGFLTDQQWDQLGDLVSDLGAAPIFIDDTPGLTIMELRAKARRLKIQEDIDVIFIDYLQLIHGKGENRQQEISQISRSLKELARELKVPIVSLSQLSRAVEAREDHRPRLSDLRESGAIEQDADIVMLLFREEYYKRDDESVKNKAEVILAKQRNGPTGSVKLTFLSDKMRFEDYIEFPMDSPSESYS